MNRVFYLCLMSKHTPHLLKGAKCPFLEDFVIPMYVRSHEEETVMVNKIKVKDGVVNSLGHRSKEKKSYPIEKDRKINLYYENNGEDLRVTYSALSKEGRALLDYIMFYCLREGKLLFYIDSKQFMEKYMIKSRTTVWNSKKDLVDLKIIAGTDFQNWYWINPKYVFRGFRSRVLEMQDNVKFKNE